MATSFVVEVDWDADGSWTDESSRARRVQCRSGLARPGDPVAEIGRCTVTLANGDGRFSPGNTSGPLYGKLLPRRAVRIRATSGGESWVVFRGFIEQLRPDAGAQADRHDCVIDCVDGLALLTQQRISVVYAASKPVDEAVSEVVAAAYDPPNSAYDDNGDALAHYGRSWTPEQTTALDALRDICQAVYGRFFIARDGTATYRSRNALQDASVSAVAVIGEEQAEYWQRIAATQPAHLIGYWRLNESAGTSVHDSGGGGRDGTANGVTWGQPGVGDGSLAAGFDGINDYITLYSAGLANAFNGNEGTLLIWMRVADNAAWTDGAYRYIARIANASDFIKVYKSNSSGRLELERRGGGVSKAHSITGLSGTDWICLALTWSDSADQQKGYMNGAPVGITHTGLAAWGSAPTIMVNGAYTTGSSSPWSGSLAHMALWDVALGGAEIAALAGV